MSYDNTNKGTLGKNKNKKSEKSPEYSGQLNVEGVEYWVSGWVKENKSSGEKFFSLALTPKQEKQDGRTDQSEAQKSSDFDDTIPF